MQAFWAFLTQPENRTILSWLGGGLCVVAAGLWAAFRQRTAQPEPPKPSGRLAQASTRDGVAAGRDVTVHGDVHIGGLPRNLALAVGLLGIALLAIAFLSGGGDTVTNGVNAGGDIAGTTITIDGSQVRTDP